MEKSRVQKIIKKDFEEQETRNSCELKRKKKSLYLEPQIKTNADRNNARNNYEGINEWITQILDPFLR